uniref:TSA: Wollemia nobilis Ref_Wollemi_Transcript_7484_1220 transcribed RNA sequence n=1 Tax=Wollemia nobilis TaxID=56998 RepID=A0A0C9S9L6_9CONI
MSSFVISYFCPSFSPLQFQNINTLVVIAFHILCSAIPVCRVRGGELGGGHMRKRIWLVGVVMWVLAIGILAEEAAGNVTVYDVLRKHGLPVGLLPKGVKSYALDEDGKLEVYLEQPCYAKFENEVFFESVIRGNLSYGQLAGVAGLEQQELFLWFPVKGIKVDIPNSGFIYFDVGVVYKQFVLSLFESPPDCRPVTNGDERLIIEMPRSTDRFQLSQTSRKAVLRKNDLPTRAVQ